MDRTAAHGIVVVCFLAVTLSSLHARQLHDPWLVIDQTMPARAQLVLTRLSVNGSTGLDVAQGLVAGANVVSQSAVPVLVTLVALAVTLLAVFRPERDSALRTR